MQLIGEVKLPQTSGGEGFWGSSFPTGLQIVPSPRDSDTGEPRLSLPQQLLLNGFFSPFPAVFSFINDAAGIELSLLREAESGWMEKQGRCQWRGHSL